MAIPVNFPSDIFTIQKSDYEFYNLLFMLTVVIASTTIFCAITIQESLYDQDEQDEKKEKENKNNKNKINKINNLLFCSHSHSMVDGGLLEIS